MVELAEDYVLTQDDVIALIPSRVSRVISSMTIAEFNHNYSHNVDIERIDENLLMWAYSYYQTLSRAQKDAVKRELHNLDVYYLLNYIGQYNPELFDEIDRITEIEADACGDEDEIGVVKYLERQIVRVQAICQAFDERAEVEREWLRSLNLEPTSGNGRK